MFKTQQIQVKKGHALYNYFYDMTQKEKRLSNATNFVIRQIYTALNNTESIHPLQKEVMDLVEETLPKMNEIRLQTYEKQRKKAIEKGEDISKVKLNVIDYPTQSSWVNYYILDSFFKCSQNVDYLALPAQSAQETIKTVTQDWKGFFVALKDYQKNPSKYSGKPSIPKYAKREKKTITFSNQDCVIKENTYLKFPKTKIRLNIGKLGFLSHGEKLVEVRCKPYADRFIIELILKTPDTKPKAYLGEVIMAVDFGVSNFMTCVFSDGSKPIIYNGNPLKSFNQYYNKQKAHYTSLLRIGKAQNEGTFISKRLLRIDVKRRNKMHDAFHKMSKHMIDLALEYGVHKIIVGKNEQWKTKTNLQKKTKQHFVQIGHAHFLRFLRYKAEAVGIKVIEQEESYTSKASSYDKDDIPTIGDEHIPNFSGRRIKRGLYRTANGTLMNADVNGAYNILRKAVPSFFEGIEVVVSQPLKLHIV